MSVQLQSLQRILQSLGIDAYLRTSSAERSMATLGIEIETGPQESNLLEVCEIPIPDSDLFLLQWFVQLPLSAPFAPSDTIPEFQIAEVLAFCAELNQILPVGIFNVFDERLCFRHIFTCEFLSQAQVEYLLQTIEGCIQRVQPRLQEVAIGTLSAEEAIESIDELFSSNSTENIEEPPHAFSTGESDSLTLESNSWQDTMEDKIHESKDDLSVPAGLDLDSPEPQTSFSIDDLATFSLNIDNSTNGDTENTEWSDEPAQDDWDDSWSVDSLANDVMVFEEDSSED